MNVQEKSVLTKAELFQKKKKSWLAKILNVNPSQRRQVILDKIEHYSKTGNLKKLDIYQRKLEELKI